MTFNLAQYRKDRDAAIKKTAGSYAVLLKSYKEAVIKLRTLPSDTEEFKGLIYKARSLKNRLLNIERSIPSWTGGNNSY